MPNSQTPNEEPTRARSRNKKQSPEYKDPATVRDALNRELDAQALHFSAQMQARVLAETAEDAANRADQTGSVTLQQSLRSWLNREVRIPIVVFAAPLMLLFAMGGVLAFSASGARSTYSGTPAGASPNPSFPSLTQAQLSSTVTLETGVFSLAELTKQGR